MISMTSHKRDLILIGILCVLVLGAFREWRVAPNGYVNIDVLDVGQGDSIFITGPRGEQILIDGGPDLSALSGIGKNMSFFDRNIDLLVLTHPDLDHVFSFPDILERYSVDAVLLTGVAHKNAAYEDMLAYIKDHAIPIIIADPSKDLDFGDGLFLDIVWPPPEYFGKTIKGDVNDTSVVIKLIYGEDSMLFTGDMEEKEERELLASGFSLDADILKVGHHGSKTSTSTGLLLAVSPDHAVISAGRDNKFGHPHRLILERLKAFEVPVRVTAQEGAIEIIFDGKEGI